MGAGNYDHPSYIARQLVPLGTTTAGANGTSNTQAYPNSMRLRNVTATVRTAGTSATSGNAAIIGCVGTCTQFGTSGTATVGTGTTTLGSIALGTGTALTTGTSGDLNATIAAGSVVYVKNGTDATGVAHVVAEMHVDPNSSWVGNG